MDPRSSSCRSSLAAACGALLLAGCNAILGLGDPVIASDAGTPGEAGSDTSIEAPAGDATLDSGGDHADAGLPMDGSGSDAMVGMPCPDGGKVGDNDNCTGCGKSCLGGVCGNGACQPFVFAYAQTSVPWSILVDQKGTVYWSNRAAGGPIEACTAGGAGGTCADGGAMSLRTSFSDGGAIPLDLAYVESQGVLFWNYDEGPTSGPGGIASCATMGCAATASLLGTSAAPTLGVSLIDSGVYTMTFDPMGEILGCTVPGCDGGTLPAVSTSLTVVNGSRITAGDGQLFWTTATTVSACDPGSGCSRVAIASDPMASYYGIAELGGNVYFTNGLANGSIDTCPIMGCAGTPNVIVSGEYKPGLLAVDGTSVYWLANDPVAYQVRSCPLSGCPGGPRMLAMSANQFASIAVDATAVYWAEQTTPNATIWKMAK